MSVCLSIHMEQLGSQCMDFHDIWYYLCLKVLWENSSFIKIWEKWQLLYMKIYVHLC